MEGEAADNSGNQSPVLIRSPPLATTIIDAREYYGLRYEHSVAFSVRPGVERRSVSLEGFLEDSSESDNGQFDFAFPLFQKWRQTPAARPRDGPDVTCACASNDSTQGMWMFKPPSLQNLHSFITINLHRRFQKVATNVVIFQWRPTKIDPRTGEAKTVLRKRLLDTPEALHAAYLEYSAQPNSSEGNVLYYTFGWKPPTTLSNKRPLIDTQDTQDTQG